MLAAPRPAEPQRPGRAAPSAFLLPLHAFRLLGTRGVGVAGWFSAGQAATSALLYLGVEAPAGEPGRVVTITVLTLVVVAHLVATAGMLHALRGGLAEFRARRIGAGPDERLLVAVDRAAPAFALLYLTWGLTGDDARELARLAALHGVAGGDAADWPAGLDVRVTLGVAVIGLLVRTACGWWYGRRQGRVAGSLAALGEVCFAFFGLLAVAAALGSAWLERRAVVAWAGDLVTRYEGVLSGPFRTWAGELLPYATQAVLLPLMWLVVGALVLGAGSRRRGGSTADPDGGLTRGPRGRCLPVLRALRLVVRGGAPLFGMFCLCFVALRAGVGYAERGARQLIGPQEGPLHLVYDRPLALLGELLLTALTVCLLAAALDLAATRARAFARPGDDEPVTART
ncbi:hypothetical protein Misp01_54810 [Microtetraspora sp. NBRC 13810]|nr:hypothetical protein Misp01_54810 [Microtetraspora sp. NBRC 13810]